MSPARSRKKKRIKKMSKLKVPLEFVEEPLDSSLALPGFSGPVHTEPMQVDRVRNIADGSKWVLKHFESPNTLLSTNLTGRSKRGQKMKNTTDSLETPRWHGRRQGITAGCRSSFVPIPVVLEHAGRNVHTGDSIPDAGHPHPAAGPAGYNDRETHQATHPGGERLDDTATDTIPMEELDSPFDRESGTTLTDRPHGHPALTSSETQPPPDISTPDCKTQTQVVSPSKTSMTSSPGIMERPIQDYTEFDLSKEIAETTSISCRATAWMQQIQAVQLLQCLRVDSAIRDGGAGYVLAPDTPEHEYGMTIKSRQLAGARDRLVMQRFDKELT